MMVSCYTKRREPITKRKEKRALHGVLTFMLMLGLMLIPGLLPEIACAADGTRTGDDSVRTDVKGDVQ